MKTILNRLIQHETLSKEEAKEVLVHIAKGSYNTSQIAAFLTVYMMRSVTIEELTGFRDALLELCVPIDLSDYDPIDLCGTGGDGKDTFNISTLASFITAAAGVPSNASSQGGPIFKDPFNWPTQNRSDLMSLSKLDWKNDATHTRTLNYRPKTRQFSQNLNNHDIDGKFKGCC